MRTDSYGNRSHRLLLIGLVAASTIAFAGEAEAQSRYRAKQSAEVHQLRSLSRNAAVVRVRGTRYYYDRGVFYHKVKGRFVLTNAPPGGVVKRLPKGSRRVIMRNRTYYRHNGIYFVKVKRGFRIVEPPAGIRYRAAWIEFPSRGIVGYFRIPGATYAWSGQNGRYRIAFDMRQSDVWDETGKRDRLNETQRRGALNEAGLDSARGSTAGRGGRAGARGGDFNG